MSIDPKSPLFQAILAMDSYNRGYASGVNLSIDSETGTIPADSLGRQIGSVTVYASNGSPAA